MLLLTERAIKEIKFIMQSQDTSPDQTYVRAGIRGGGCSGYENLFCLDENYDETKDILYEQDGIRLIVDKRSDMYLSGATVDFAERIDRRGFVFDNPIAKSSCSCGSSFSV